MILRVSIEPSWSHGTHTAELELDPADFEGLTDEEREKEFQEIATDMVNNGVSWGWEVIE